jgi:PIN domain nuclease of toxin-antitoxin system
MPAPDPSATPPTAPAAAPAGLVFDSFAVLALLEDEPGADEVAGLLSAEAAHLLMTYVNLGEVLYTIIKERGQDRADTALLALEAAKLTFVPAERSLTLEAARYKARYRISYADAYCAALSSLTGFPLVTGDPEFRQLEGQIPIHWVSSPADS